MKETSPEVHRNQVTCSCGNTFTTRSTVEQAAARRSLLGVPPVLHRQAEDHGHRRPRREVPPALRHQATTARRRRACADRKAPLLARRAARAEAASAAFFIAALCARYLPHDALQLMRAPRPYTSEAGRSRPTVEPLGRRFARSSRSGSCCCARHGWCSGSPATTRGRPRTRPPSASPVDMAAARRLRRAASRRASRTSRSPPLPTRPGARCRSSAIRPAAELHDAARIVVAASSWPPSCRSSRSQAASSTAARSAGCPC